ncbi:MAG: hypothetical protein J6L69_08115 [Lachnospiraceae bacterium]|nr:hypothetical protein [Lachnospiraceae bacterium]
MRKESMIFAIVIEALALILVVLVLIIGLPASKRINLDEDTKKAYVEYAVNAVVNHDKNNMLKMERVEIDNEKETIWISDDDIVADGSGDSTDSSTKPNQGDSVQDTATYVDFSKALGNDNFSVKLSGIKECKSYPESGEELAFVITASTGSRLVVAELEMTNTSKNAITLDTTDNYSFKGIINGVVRTNALMALDYSLNGSKHSFAAGETKKLALIFELNSERVPEVNKVVVSVTRDDNTYNVNVK